LVISPSLELLFHMNGYLTEKMSLLEQTLQNEGERSLRTTKCIHHYTRSLYR
jgi:hypothetical protein